MYKKTEKTLKKFCAELGSQEKAAQAIGTTYNTVNRWLNGHASPRGLYASRLKELGIKVR